MVWTTSFENYYGYHQCSSTGNNCSNPIRVTNIWTSCTSGLQWTHNLGAGVGASPTDYSKSQEVKCCCSFNNSKCDSCNYF